MTKPKKFPIPLRYPGGKFYAIEVLRPFFETKHYEYREPFAGGATVFFHKEKADKTWLNDLDTELITFYKTIQDEGLSVKLSNIYRTEEEATKDRWKEVLDFQPKNDFEIAWKYYFLNRTSFSGKLVSAAWGYRPKRSLPPFRWHERIEPSGKKLKDVSLTSLDFENVIKAPSENDAENVLLYVDPPYFLPPKFKHYRHGFDLVDHERLSEILSKTEYKFFLTYDDCPQIRELYKWANIYELNFLYRVQNSNFSSGSRKIGFELIITNFDVEGIPKDE